MRPRSVYAEGLQGRGEWHSGISESVTYPPLPSPITPRPTCSRPPSEAPAAGPGPTLRSCIMRRGGGSAGAAAATARGAPSSTPSLPASDRPLRAVPAPLVTQPCDADASACGGGGKAARPNPMLPRASACECVRAGFGDERVGDETRASVGDGGRASSRMPLSAQPPPPPPSNWCRPPAPPGERPAMSAGKAAAGPARGLNLRGEQGGPGNGCKRPRMRPHTCSPSSPRRCDPQGHGARVACPAVAAAPGMRRRGAAPAAAAPHATPAARGASAAAPHASAATWGSGAGACRDASRGQFARGACKQQQVYDWAVLRHLFSSLIPRRTCGQGSPTALLPALSPLPSPDAPAGSRSTDVDGAKVRWRRELESSALRDMPARLWWRCRSGRRAAKGRARMDTAGERALDWKGGASGRHPRVWAGSASAPMRRRRPACGTRSQRSARRPPATRRRRCHYWGRRRCYRRASQRLPPLPQGAR